jgi:sugar phosphate isomerase/epimerase
LLRASLGIASPLVRFIAAVVVLCSAAQSRAASLAENPFFVFDNGAGRGAWTPERQAETLEKLGYDGISYSGVEDLGERMKAFDHRAPRIMNLYVPCYVDQDPAIPPALRDAIPNLRDSGIALWLTVQGHAETDARAVSVVREVADLAAEAGLQVSLYPHAGFFVADIEDALRIAKQCKRDNLGVTFNLCHELKAGNADRFDELLETAAPLLTFVSINGADPEGDWDRLIQRLGEGTFDIAGVLRKLVALEYTGPIGLQCYQVPGDTRENLAHNIQQWRQTERMLEARE